MPFVAPRVRGASRLTLRLSDQRMKLTIVIPAYNEEEAIAAIIERTLAARSVIMSRSPVRDVEIIVVSDGSTDDTVRIASQYDGVRLIVFERNRGYGAAIKRGFEEGTGDLVGFLDADGTCDPDFFADLCTAVVEHDAAVALGSRLGDGSRMPRVRRLGNRIYALILSVLSNKPVTDTASGMRVIRRDVLDQLYPLPDGLNFTPAMSARVLMDDRMRIVELPMSYEERVGQSKLNVLRDGVAFLQTIGQMALVWRPMRMFWAAAVACLFVMSVLLAGPFESWLRFGKLGEDMIYRLLFCSLLGSFGAVLVSATVLSYALRDLLDERPAPRTFFTLLLDRVYTLKGCAVAGALLAPLLAWLIGAGVLTYLTERAVYIHWSRVVLAGLLVFALSQMMVTTLLANVIRFHVPRRRARVLAEKTRSVVEIPMLPAAGGSGQLLPRA